MAMYDTQTSATRSPAPTAHPGMFDADVFGATDLDELYRLINSRKTRLELLIETRAPEIIVRNERRMLREAVDALFEDGEVSAIVAYLGVKTFKTYLQYVAGTVIDDPAVAMAAGSRAA